MTPSRRRTTLPATLAGVVAAALAGWWTATWLRVIPTAFEPNRTEWSHVAAELGTALLLAIGAALSFRDSRPHWVLAVGFGALAYAVTDIAGEYARTPGMLVTLGLTLMLTVAATVAAFGPGNRRVADH